MLAEPCLEALRLTGKPLVHHSHTSSSVACTLLCDLGEPYPPLCSTLHPDRNPDPKRYAAVKQPYPGQLLLQRLLFGTCSSTKQTIYYVTQIHGLVLLITHGKAS